MNKKYFHPTLFFDILDKEMSIKEIAKKAKCSETTAENNLRVLYQGGKVVKQWKYGMWIWRKK